MDDEAVAAVKTVLKEKLSEQQLALFRDEDYIALSKALGSVSKVTGAATHPGVEDIEAAIMEERNRIQDEIVPLLQNFKADKNDFPSSKGPICGRGSSQKQEPCLLYHEMGTDSVKVDKRLVERLDGTLPQVTVLLAPSGSGKTRQLIELACLKHCFYFMGCKQSLGPAPGSGDLKRMKDWLASSFAEGTEIPEYAVCVGVGIMLLGRLLVLRFLRQLEVWSSPREWLFFQLEFPVVFDVFGTFVHRALLHLKHTTNWFALAGHIMDMVFRESSWLDWDGFVVVDEAQEVNRWLRDRFRSQPGVFRSFTNPFLLQLLDAYSVVGKSIFVAGTGRSMTQVAESLHSGQIKPYNVLEIRKLPGFDSFEEMERYVKQIIDTSRVDMEEIFFTYMGRPRWLVTALERYVSVPHPDGTETSYLVDFSDRIISVTGRELGLVRSLWDDAKEVLNHVGYHIVLKIVIAHAYHGRKHPLVLPFNLATLQLIDCSLAYVEEDKPLSDFLHLGPAPNGGTIRAVSLREPLAMRALLRAIPREGHAENLLEASVFGDSALGNAHENTALVGFGLNGLRPGKLNYFSQRQVDSLYLEVFELVRPRFKSTVMCQDVSDIYGISHWVNAVEDGRDFPTFLATGGLGEGPDLMFFMRAKPSDTMVICFAQHKCRKVVDNWDGLRTLDVKKMFRGVAGMERLRKYAESGYLQILVATQFQRFRYQALKEERHVAASTVGRVAPLVVYIDRDNVYTCIDDYVLQVVEYSKRRKQETEVSTSEDMTRGKAKKYV